MATERTTHNCGKTSITFSTNATPAAHAWGYSTLCVLFIIIFTLPCWQYISLSFFCSPLNRFRSQDRQQIRTKRSELLKKGSLNIAIFGEKPHRAVSDGEWLNCSSVKRNLLIISQHVVLLISESLIQRMSGFSHPELVSWIFCHHIFHVLYDLKSVKERDQRMPFNNVSHTFSSFKLIFF